MVAAYPTAVWVVGRGGKGVRGGGARGQRADLRGARGARGTDRRRPPGPRGAARPEGRPRGPHPPAQGPPGRVNPRTPSPPCVGRLWRMEVISEAVAPTGTPKALARPRPKAQASVRPFQALGWSGGRFPAVDGLVCRCNVSTESSHKNTRQDFSLQKTRICAKYY